MWTCLFERHVIHVHTSDNLFHYISFARRIQACDHAFKEKIGIIVPDNRNDKVIPQIKPERYNIIEVNDNAD